MIYLRENVRRAVETALQHAPNSGTEAAIAAVAAATGLSPEAVRECLNDAEHPA